MKYAEWLNMWLENYIKPSSKERMYIRYGQLIRTHIAPEIGKTERYSGRKMQDVEIIYKFVGAINLPQYGSD